MGAFFLGKSFSETVKVLKFLLVLLFCVGFLLPFHFFPYQDLPNDLASMLVASILFCATLASYRKQAIALPISGLMVLLLGGLVVVSSLVQGEFLFSDYSYLIFLLSGILVATSVATLREQGDDLTPLLARAFYWIALITATYGLLRHYGVLKFLLPWITGETPRLLGPLNQANLTALVLGIGVLSSSFLLIAKRMRFFPVLLSVSYLAMAAGLTGSRAFVAFVLLIIVLPSAKLILSPANVRRELFSRVYFGRGKELALIVVTITAITFLFPAISRPFTDALVESGFIQRDEEESIADRFRLTDNYRAEEWRKLGVYWEIAKDPLTGFGPGRYGVFSLEADKAVENPIRMGTLWTHGHNLFVNVLVELGVLGLLAVLLLLGYLVFLFYRCSFKPRDFFVFSLLGALFINNMVEFSFWFFSFFALAIALVAQVDGRIVLRFSVAALPVSIGGAVLATALLTTAYVANDVWASVKGFHKAQLGDEEQYAFLDAKKNRFVGGDALKAEIIREQVSLFGVNAQIQELERYMSWRPEMVFMLRHAALRSVKGPKEQACARVKETVGFYPNSVERLAEELLEAKQLGATFDIAYIHGCLAEGMMYWVNRSEGTTSPGEG
ncbi:O-antigen ligase family protein [Marinobacter salsuginis]|uniref:O-antigen ligase family protein n=1 Tax=Marinobacter salsuginis TaxID=418719 RepID=UPI001C97E139|nr:O-antigen ligase family protein [Marinobacter salsuginis]MBY6070809.1 O-antigen ligase family protein [Marinobacter salsuginis]